MEAGTSQPMRAIHGGDDPYCPPAIEVLGGIEETLGFKEAGTADEPFSGGGGVDSPGG